jgi:unsaturated pyranuronate lyase
MPIVDTKSLEVGQPRPGWHDRYFHSATMSFAYYDVDAGASVHEHSHPEEEVWHVIEGTLEVTLNGETFIAGPGTAAIVPSAALHSVKALTQAKVIIATTPFENESSSTVRDVRPSDAGGYDVARAAPGDYSRRDTTTRRQGPSGGIR